MIKIKLFCIKRLFKHFNWHNFDDSVITDTRFKFDLITSD